MATTDRQSGSLSRPADAEITVFRSYTIHDPVNICPALSFPLFQEQRELCHLIRTRRTFCVATTDRQSGSLSHKGSASALHFYEPMIVPLSGCRAQMYPFCNFLRAKKSAPILIRPNVRHYYITCGNVRQEAAREKLWDKIVLDAYCICRDRVLYLQRSAGVMELVDVVDSKSTAGDSVPVRVRSPAL